MKSIFSLPKYKAIFCQSTPKIQDPIYLEMSKLITKGTATPGAFRTAMYKNYFGLHEIIGRQQKESNDKCMSGSEYEGTQSQQDSENEVPQPEVILFEITPEDWKIINLKIRPFKNQNKVYPEKNCWSHIIHKYVSEKTGLTCAFAYNFVNKNTFCGAECDECGAQIKIKLLKTTPEFEEVQCELTVFNRNDNSPHSKKRHLSGKFMFLLIFNDE